MMDVIAQIAAIPEARPPPTGRYGHTLTRVPRCARAPRACVLGIERTRPRRSTNVGVVRERHEQSDDFPFATHSREG